MKWSIFLILSFPLSCFAEYFPDQSYGPEPQHRYDLATGQSQTLLILVHGGGWVKGDKRAANFDQGEAVKYVAARYGLNVASVNYTLARNGAPTAPLSVTGPKPRPTHNVMIAAMKIKKRVGASRVVLLGTSAGANISALTYAYYPSIIDGFIGFYGAYQLTRQHDFSLTVQRMIDTYTGGSGRKKQTASPINIRFPIKKYLLFHGSDDTVVSSQQSSRMAAVKSTGELYIVDGVNHGFKVFGDKDHPAPWVERLIRFTYTGE